VGVVVLVYVCVCVVVGLVGLAYWFSFILFFYFGLVAVFCFDCCGYVWCSSVMCVVFMCSLGVVFMVVICCIVAGWVL